MKSLLSLSLILLPLASFAVMDPAALATMFENTKYNSVNCKVVTQPDADVLSFEFYSEFNTMADHLDTIGEMSMGIDTEVTPDPIEKRIPSAAVYAFPPMKLLTDDASVKVGIQDWDQGTVEIEARVTMASQDSMVFRFPYTGAEGFVPAQAFVAATDETTGEEFMAPATENDAQKVECQFTALH